MGVRQCNRRGCQSIMCDHYSNKYGYICVECRNELMGLRLNLSDVPSTKIRDFMDSRRKSENEFLTDLFSRLVVEEFPSQTNYDLGGDV